MNTSLYAGFVSLFFVGWLQEEVQDHDVHQHEYQKILEPLNRKEDVNLI